MSQQGLALEDELLLPSEDAQVFFDDGLKHSNTESLSTVIWQDNVVANTTTSLDQDFHRKSVSSSPSRHLKSISSAQVRCISSSPLHQL
jgi:hypothetical protein